MSLRARGRVALVGGLLVLCGLAASVAHPLVRARYHLRSATSNEVTIDSDGSTRLTGHARAFVESSAAKDLLPDVATLALAESDKDSELCFRVLVFELTSAAAARPACEIMWARPSDELPPRARPPAPESDEVLRLLLSGLRSRSCLLRAWTLSHLPLDPRLVEAVSRHLSSSGPDELGDDEAREILRWLTSFALSNQDLVQQEHRRQIPMPSIPGPPVEWNLPDRAWYDILGRDEPGDRSSPGSALPAWIEKHRAKLPPQILR